MRQSITAAPRRSNRVRPYYRIWERQKATQDALSAELLRRTLAGLEALR
ncbi:hypothetical protein FHX37_0607 [Haloactinospora alba]|uniref:Uncharacterized protein n=1 Tax=Haloactinospora alba TaxID=405555 RepID=A0A543NFV9_9ACTN|nr:hypothetical protein [Haloactinospora alba]TQN30725.1 hypothetical protein FHX37_0607 [Haloactinospora alba]